MTVDELVANCAFGCSLQVGERLNSAISENHGIKAVDAITVEVTNAESVLAGGAAAAGAADAESTLESWRFSYEKLRRFGSRNEKTPSR